VTLDAGNEPVQLWRLLSAAAPYITAIFANSPCCGGERSGYQSARAEAWRELDRTRTGLPAASAVDPAADYAAFALRAPSILLCDQDGAHRPFHALLTTGEAGEADWGPHLTTLFPEVRPRRLGETATFEVRSADAIEPTWYAAPLVMLAGLSYDDRARCEAARLLGAGGAGGAASLELLDRAGEVGLGDPEIRSGAAELFTIGLEGAVRLGSEVVGGEALETAREFGDRYVIRARSLADDTRVLDGDVAAWRLGGEESAAARS
jgi:glutamate--cysteine ligase